MPANTDQTETIAAPAGLPGVDRLLQDARLSDLAARAGRSCVVEAARTVLDDARARLLEGGRVDPDGLAERVVAHVAAAAAPSLRPVLNLTGTVIHTNLGRSALPEPVIEAMAEAARQPVDLEYDLLAGRRGSREGRLEARIRSLTGADAATAVNNNAAAVMLVLNTLANRRAVPVSRGELVEIGGSFRLPDIMRRAGARLVEVGTTNRTHLRDYEEAMAARPALVLKAHTSNYSVIGFTKAVPERELADLCRRRGIPFCIDLGSGTLIDLERFHLPHEPTVQEALAGGAELVTFSGDKLLGGPQAGVIAGRADLIERIKKNPMHRAFRLDKLRIAALDATLALYGQPEQLAETVPTLRWLARPLPDIRAVAERVAVHLEPVAPDGWQVEVTDCFSQIGSGALPAEALPSVAVRLTPQAGRRKMGKRAAGRVLRDIAAAFRALPVPAIGRVGEGAFWLDMRCLETPETLLGQIESLAWPSPP
ncbi:MAG: L-seryl-tRNA(Sec) selenium transferase [Rhodospirillaceae bacterium]|nr:L-seryl-tRNA(Sec) selenium transferase [Rhodospirillaceae bacterium]